MPHEAIKSDAHDPAFKTINPAAAVPALDYGGAAPLTQCAAILDYLALLHPEADLLNDRSPEQAATLAKWAAFLTGDFHPAFRPVFMPGRYTVAKDAAALVDVKAAGLVLVRSKLGLLDRQVAGRSWVVGDKRTIVDAYATHMLNWASAMLPDALGGFPACHAHRERMHADPGVRRAVQAEGLTPVGS